MISDDTEMFSESITFEDGPHHSTPIKSSPLQSKHRLSKPGRVTARIEPSSNLLVRPVSHDFNHSATPSNTSISSITTRLGSHVSKSSSTPSSLQKPGIDSTIYRQRREIELLIKELRDRDTELNETVSAHSQQILAWERDRQRLLSLEQKLSRTEGELSKKKKHLDVALTKLKKPCCSSTDQEKLSNENQQNREQVNTLERQNHGLNDSLKAMSSTIGQLEAREQELMTILRLKEAEVRQAEVSMGDLTSRIRQLDVRCSECQTREADAVQRAMQWKSKYTELQRKIDNITGELEAKCQGLSEQNVELVQELKSTQEQLYVAFEQDSSKERVIESLRCKQERILSELHTVRELYDRQQRELTLLQLNLDSSQDNSNHISNMEDSIILDDSIIDEGNLSPVIKSPQQHSVNDDGQHLSFDQQLSSFLDGNGSNDEIQSPVVNESSPASKLQRLLTESRLMIESLEKTTIPVADSNSFQVCSENGNPTGAGELQSTMTDEANKIQVSFHQGRYQILPLQTRTRTQTSAPVLSVSLVRPTPKLVELSSTMPEFSEENVSGSIAPSSRHANVTHPPLTIGQSKSFNMYVPQSDDNCSYRLLYPDNGEKYFVYAQQLHTGDTDRNRMLESPQRQRGERSKGTAEIIELPYST